MTILEIANTVLSRKILKVVSASNKYDAELTFWRNTLEDYVRWYRGDLKVLYKEKTPRMKDRVVVQNEKDSAILTWEKIHQQKKYLEDLKLSKNIFKGKTVLDIGSGPHPSARAFIGSTLYCLDPLLSQYTQVGFPLHYYDKTRFVVAYSENIPLLDHSIDVVISVNALDHVDDFEKTALEIKRVLKKNGKLRFHLHYHRATTEEPLELTDERVARAFAWAKSFRKISESRHKRGTTLQNHDEKFTLWSNFD